jgi:hypothetical protein
MFRTAGAVLLICLFLPAGCSRQNLPLAPLPLTQDEAVALIANLPESLVWADFIEKASRGEAHAAFVPNGDLKDPPLDGWEVWRMESHPDHYVRSEIFLVDKASRAVFVYDDLAPEGQEFIPLAQWRKQRPQ